jgi:hypothetical protein
MKRRLLMAFSSEHHIPVVGLVAVPLFRRRTLAGVNPERKRRLAKDPWGGRQPKYLALVMRGSKHFEIVAETLSGERVSARLGRVSFRTRRAS